MQLTRRLVQLGFLVLTIVGVFVLKGNAELWCPFGGVEAAYSFITDRTMLCSLGVSNFYILGAILLLAILMRRSFCGYVCPIGTISYWLRKPGSKLRKKAIKVPDKVDAALSYLKYVVLFLILYVTWSHAELYFRTADPCYALLSRHGEDITIWAYIVSGLIILGSLLMVVPFCRWLCPFAAVMNLFSRFGYTRIRRHEDACINCGKCKQVCPVNIPVDKVKEVTHARCYSCFECVDACPKQKEGALTWNGAFSSSRKSLPRGLVVGAILLVLTAAVAGVYLFPVASYTWVRDGVEKPSHTEMVEMKVENLSCRGSATLFVFYLERDDLFALDGYLKLAAWPGPGAVDVHVTYDPEKVTEDDVKAAITEAYYDPIDERWRPSKFYIEGYDIFDVE